MNLLHVTPSFYPAMSYGGPVNFLYSLCNILVTYPDVVLRVLTTDTMGKSRNDILRSHPKFDYEVSYIHKVVGHDISIEFLHRLPALIRWADVVHLTGVYSFPTFPTLTFCKRTRKPVIWSPHGSFIPWNGAALTPFKRVWNYFCNALCDISRVRIHVTSTREGTASRASISRSGFVFIPHGVDVPANPLEKSWRPEGTLRMVYIGRLHPIKGLEHLLTALSSCQQDVSLTIVGDGEKPYVESLKAIVHRLGITTRVRFTGALYSFEKEAIYSEADVLALPSHSENFGMVVTEALARGIPVLASKGTPWNGLVEHRCGWWVENSPEALSHAMEQAVQSDLAAMGERAREWMKNEFSWDSVADRMVASYRSMIHTNYPKAQQSTS